MSKFSIKARLGLILGFMAVLMAGGGAIGVGGMAVTNATLEATYKNRLEPAVLIGRIALLMNENRSQVMLSLQHDPGSAFAKLHDHVLAKHLDTVARNRDEIAALWQDYSARRLAPEEQALADKYAAALTRYADAGVKPAIDALGRGDFLQANEVLLTEVNPLYQEAHAAADTLLKATLQTARQDYEQSAARYRVVFILALGGTFVGIALAILSGMFLVRSIVGPLKMIAGHFDRIAGGRLNDPIPPGHDNEIGHCLQALTRMQAGLRDAIGAIAQSAQRIDGHCAALHTDIEHMAERSDRQLDRVRNVATAIEQTSQSIAEVAASADATVKSAVASQEIVTVSNRQMVDGMGNIGKVVHAVEMSSKTIGELGASVAHVNSISQVIKEIADQTNLLALNAAIEAARAGEAGRGFAVVADEVRKLAERTAASTGDISRTVMEIQTVANDAVASMGQASHAVDESISGISATSATISSIMTSSQEVTDMAQRIATATQQQSIATQEVAGNMEALSELVAENNADTQEARQATAGVMQEAESLRALVGRFEL